MKNIFLANLIVFRDCHNLKTLSFHLHKILWIFFCCFFLGACLGGGGSSSSSSNSASEPKGGDGQGGSEPKGGDGQGGSEPKGGDGQGGSEPKGGDGQGDSETREEIIQSSSETKKECFVKNGVGELREGKCMVVACNAGYDDHDNDNDCEKTIAEHYSIAASKSREPCIGKPANSSWTLATGLANVNECKWTCDAGYDNEDSHSQCQVTIAGYYSPEGSNARTSCSTVTVPNDATVDNASKGLRSPSQCFTCNVAGYVSTGSVCARESIAIAAGASHTCAILSNNTIKCWGDKTDGGSPLSNGETATHIAAGASHTCAILSNNTIKCWGDNGDGQTGGGSPSSSRTISGTVGSPLGNGETATHIAAGTEHTCAILSDKTVKCWGDNGDGQTGGGSPSNSRTISGTVGSPLGNGETATHIAAGTEHTCAILSDKTVKCWGDNGDGQTGGGSPLSNGETATHIAAGASHTCAILSNDDASNGGPVKCWGYNWDGRIGGGLHHYYNQYSISGTEGSPLSNGETATHIAAGASYTCAILSDDDTSNGGPVKCWGNNLSGQTGGGSPLSQGEEATHIAAGASHTCAILSNKTVKCWGSDSYRKTRGGSPLNNGETAIAIVAKQSKSCAILSDNTIKCWGRHEWQRSLLSSKETATHIAAGASHTCAILSDQTVKCWNAPNLYRPLSSEETATYIAAGSFHTCAILSDDDTSNGGPVKCWSEGIWGNIYAQIGGGNNWSSTISGTEGSPLSNDETATHIAAGGESHLCDLER